MGIKCVLNAPSLCAATTSKIHQLRQSAPFAGAKLCGWWRWKLKPPIKRLGNQECLQIALRKAVGYQLYRHLGKLGAMAQLGLINALIKHEKCQIYVLPTFWLNIKICALLGICIKDLFIV